MTFIVRRVCFAQVADSACQALWKALSRTVRTALGQNGRVLQLRPQPRVRAPLLRSVRPAGVRPRRGRGGTGGRAGRTPVLRGHAVPAGAVWLAGDGAPTGDGVRRGSARNGRLIVIWATGRRRLPLMPASCPE